MFQKPLRKFPEFVLKSKPLSNLFLGSVMISEGYFRLIHAGQWVAMGLIGGAAVSGTLTCIFAFAGVLPWLHMNVTFGGAEVAWFGQAVQIGVTVFLLLLTTYLPTAGRVLALETSHRQFAIGMEDVTRAYRAAHAADRSGAFRLQREFDAVRERFQHLQADPDLAEIDAELLTIAAQMSEQSRDLAEAFSEDRVARVTEALKQRKADAEKLQMRIQSAFADSRELRRLIDDVDMEESAAAAQIERLREVLAELGVSDPKGGKRKVTHLKTVKPA